MGLPSLLEDIVQKRIDNFLESQVHSGQFYTRGDFKRAVARLGINARELLNVDDDELVEISEEFAKETKVLRTKNDSLNKLEKEANSRADKLQRALEIASEKNRRLEAVMSKLTAHKAEENARLLRLEAKLSECEKLNKALTIDLTEKVNEIEDLHKAVMAGLIGGQ
ncbi:MAG: hypothetical protein WBA51_03155 [Erythrobacter sp.]